MKYYNNVYAVNYDEGRVLDFANDAKTMKKRIPLKKSPYPEGTVFMKVAKRSPLIS